MDCRECPSCGLRGSDNHGSTIKEVVIEQAVNNPTTSKPATKEASQVDPLPNAISDKDGEQDVAMEDSEGLFAKGIGGNDAPKYSSQQQSPELATQAQDQESPEGPLGVEHGGIGLSRMTSATCQQRSLRSPWRIRQCVHLRNVNHLRVNLLNHYKQFYLHFLRTVAGLFLRAILLIYKLLLALVLLASCFVTVEALDLLLSLLVF